jgi:hypothetical protein
VLIDFSGACCAEAPRPKDPAAANFVVIRDHDAS